MEKLSSSMRAFLLYTSFQREKVPLKEAFVEHLSEVAPPSFKPCHNTYYFVIILLIFLILLICFPV